MEEVMVLVIWQALDNILLVICQV